MRKFIIFIALFARITIKIRAQPFAPWKTYTLAVNFEGESETANLKIVNMLGEIVMQKQLNAVEGIFETQMDIANLKSGIYMLKVETENGESRKIFVKE